MEKDGNGCFPACDDGLTGAYTVQVYIQHVHPIRLEKKNTYDTQSKKSHKLEKLAASL